MEKTAYDQRNGAARRKQKPHKRSVLRKSCTFIEIFFRNRLTKSRRDGKIYRQSAVAVKIESGRVPEWPMGTDCKSAAFQLRWFESTRAHQKSFNVTTTLELFALCVRETHECGWIRTASARRTVRRAKSPSGAFLDARLAISTRAHQKSSIRTGYWIFCFVETFSGPGGKKANVKTKVRSLPRPVGCVKLEEKIALMRCILGGNRL